MSTVQKPNLETPIQPQAAGLRLGGGNFSNPEAVIAQAHLQLEKLRDGSRRDRLQARRIAEKEARIEIKKERKAARLEMIKQMVVSAVSVGLSTMSMLSKTVRDFFEGLGEAFKSTFDSLKTGFLQAVDASFGKFIADLKESAANHGLLRNSADNQAKDSEEFANDAQKYSDRALSHLQAVAQAQDKAKDAAII